MILTSNTIGVFFRIVGNLESVSTLLVGGKVTNIVDKEGLTTATKKILTRKNLKNAIQIVPLNLKLLPAVIDTSLNVSLSRDSTYSPQSIS